MNFLITAVGSMASEATIKGLRDLYPESKIGATDIYPANWLWQSGIADSFCRVPEASDDSYISVLFDICVNNNIDFVIPLIDPEVDVLSEHFQTFEDAGITLCIPPKNAIDICRDKLIHHKKLKSKKNVHVIPTLTCLDAAIKKFGYPVICKPRKGRSSEGIIKIMNENNSFHSMDGLQNYLIQPYIHGDIYTADVVRDEFGNSTSVVRKELIRNKIGAGVTVEVMNHPELENISSEIASELEVTGVINIEYIFHDKTYFVMDINPRFSAGVHFTVLSGYNVVKNNLRVFLKQKIEPKPMLKEGLYYKSYRTHN